MDLATSRVSMSKRMRRSAIRRLVLNRRKLALLLLAFALVTTADTCTDPETGEPIPHEHTPAPTPAPTPKPDGPGPPPTCPPGQVPWGIFGEWAGCADDPNAPNPPPITEEEPDDNTSKPTPGTYTVDPGSTEDGEEILVERPPLCSTVTGDTPCIVSYHQDEDGNEVWVLPPGEGENTEDSVNTVFCGNLGDSLDHSDAPTPHVHPAPFPYDHDGNPQTPDICSHNSENCAWHGTCPTPQPINPPTVPTPPVVTPTVPTPQPTNPPTVPTPPVVTPTVPTPVPKVCTTSWSDSDRQRLLDSLRWESIIPYPTGFADYHHPEVPGGQIFLTAASTAFNPVRHWTALQPGTSLNVVDAPTNGCLWTATAVGVSLREVLPSEPSDLAKLRAPGNAAAANEARQAAALWDRLSPERKQWFRRAFPRTDPSTVWCAPSDLPPWTSPSNGVLALSSNWENRHGQCRWIIPRRGFWQWQLQVQFTSEQGDQYTETLASDLSWFRDPTGYLGQQVTLW